MIEEEKYIKKMGVIFVTLPFIMIAFAIVLAWVDERYPLIFIIFFILFLITFLIILIVAIINFKKMKRARNNIMSYYQNFDTSKGSYSYDLRTTIFGQDKPINKKMAVVVDNKGFALTKNELVLSYDWVDYEMKIEKKYVGGGRYGGRRLALYLMIFSLNEAIRITCDIKNYYLFSRYSQKTIVFNQKDRKILEKTLGADFDKIDLFDI